MRSVSSEHRQLRACRLAIVCLVFLLFSRTIAAQEVTQFWPEVDAYVKMNDSSRLYFLASQTRENSTGTQAKLGANFDYYLKPLLKLKKIADLQLDESKSRPLLLRAGYEYLPSPTSPTENRIVLEATPRYPFIHGILVTDRNRADLRFIEGVFSWRYRNRLMIERSFKIKGYTITPYARAEVFYDSNYNKFSRTTEDLGCIFPVTKHIELENYFEHQNDTSKAPNRQVNAISLMLNLYL